MDRNLREAEIYFTIDINADLEAVWRQWTTPEGLCAFFAPQVNVDLRIGGPFEILFDLEAPPGNRGSEGMEILAIEEKKMISFTWNAPPKISEIRKQRTIVSIVFVALDQGKTKVVLKNVGYGFGAEWEKALEYFKIAWGNVVLPRLKHSLEVGPIDWENRPDLKQFYLYQRDHL